MKNWQRFLIFGLLSFFVVTILFYQGFLPLPLAEGSHGGSHSLSGYAWGSNLGWISFKGLTTNSGDEYKVESVLLSGSKFSGYAWSSNGGWINFDPSTTFASGDGWPSIAVNKHGVKLDSTGTALIGWARACSVFMNDSSANRCKGDLRPSSERGGWDGWISMNCLNTDSCLTSDYKISNLGTGQLSGFAWGSDVIGWVDFCGTASGNGNYCVAVDSLTVPCSATDANGDGRFEVNEGVTWTASVVSGGISPYTFCWGNGAGSGCDIQGPVGEVNALESGVNSADHSVIVPPPSGYAGGQHLAAFKVTDSLGKTGSNTCLIQVEDLSNPTLTVNVGSSGDAAGKVTAIPPGTANDPSAWTTNGCQVSPSNQLSICQVTYQPNESVTLKADPDPITGAVPPADYSFTWQDCPGTVSGSDCLVTMNESESASVTFWNQNDPTVTLTPNCSSYTNGICTIWISFHSEGQSAESNGAKVTADKDAKLCVASFISRTGDSIDQVTGSNSQDRVECLLGGNPGSCTDGNTCLDIKQGEPSAFSVKVPTKLIELVRNNPYQIILRANGRPGPDSQITIRFEYRVRDIRP